jgi:hypothetical protein
MGTFKASPAAAFTALLSFAGFAAAAPGSDQPAEANIPFANHHGIYSWRVVNDQVVLIQAENRKWYKATLLTHCIDLPFAEHVGFETNPDGSFDKFSSIRLRHQNCPLVSLVETAAPGKKANSNKVTNPAPAAAANKPS